MDSRGKMRISRGNLAGAGHFHPVKKPAEFPENETDDYR